MAVGILFTPQPVLAATAEVVTERVEAPRSAPSFFDEVRYTAAPAESNAVTVTAGADGVTIRDPGAEITPRRGCSAIDAHAVICRSTGPPVVALSVLTEDGDDRIAAELPPETGFRFTALGGAGDDTVAGGDRAAGDHLIGGDGNDSLDGRDGNDTLSGGAGRDVLLGGGGGDGLAGDVDRVVEDDVIDGGDGVDGVGFGSNHPAVVVDLADSAPDGAPGEADVLRNVENVSGTDGTDVLRGDSGANVLDGGGPEDAPLGTVFAPPPGDVLDGREGDDQLRGSAGNDQLIGGENDDTLSGSTGRDRYSAGAGDDRLELDFDAPGTADRVRCEAGMDLVSDPQARDVVPRDCERIELDFLGVSPRGRTSRGALEFDIEANPGERLYARCGVLRLGEPAGSLGRLVFTMPRIGRKRVTVPLSARGRRVLARTDPTRMLVRFGSYQRCRRGRPSFRDSSGAYTAEF